MFNYCKKFFADILTEDEDSKVYNPARVIWVSGAIIFFGLAIFHTAVTGEFDPMGYGGGFGAILGAGGASLWFTHKSDPS